MSENPTGRPPKDAPILKEKHVEFIGAAAANGYSARECDALLKKEFGVLASYDAIRHYYGYLNKFAQAVEDKLKDRPVTVESVAEAVREFRPKSKRIVTLFFIFLTERRKIAEDPSYGVIFASKRRRLLKLSQNIEELDTPKVTAKGSYPISKASDGSMAFEKFTIANKSHDEQRKHIESMGELVDGQSGGDVIIQIVDNPSPEDKKKPEEKKDEEKE